MFISDTHGMHNRMTHALPAGDVLVHCGDMSAHGRHEELRDVAHWLGKQNFKHKIAIAGNHDAALEGAFYFNSLYGRAELCHSSDLRTRTEELFQYAGVNYLCDRSIELDGVKFYGAPWTPNFCNWHFMPPRNSEELKAKWDAIPDDVQVLVTHGPPHGILDAYVEPDYIAAADQVHVGCELLAERIASLGKLQVHAFGHIHEGYGTYPMFNNGSTGWFVNAAICTREYKPTNRPIEVVL